MDIRLSEVDESFRIAGHRRDDVAGLNLLARDPANVSNARATQPFRRFAVTRGFREQQEVQVRRPLTGEAADACHASYAGVELGVEGGGNPTHYASPPAAGIAQS